MHTHAIAIIFCVHASWLCFVFAYAVLPILAMAMHALSASREMQNAILIQCLSYNCSSCNNVRKRDRDMQGMQLHTWLASEDIQPAEQNSGMPPYRCTRCTDQKQIITVESGEFRLGAMYAVEFGRRAPSSPLQVADFMHVRRSHFETRCYASLQLCHAFRIRASYLLLAGQDCKCARTRVQNKWTTAALEIQKYSASSQKYKNKK